MEEKKVTAKLQLERKPAICSVCGGQLVYISHGEYRCEECSAVERDDFGKVHHYLDEHGPASAFKIAEATKVPISTVNKFLKEGRLEIPEGSDIYIPCERCGTDIRYGRFCPACAMALSKSIKGALEMGEVPKKKSSTGGKMHFLADKDNLKRY